MRTERCVVPSMAVILLLLVGAAAAPLVLLTPAAHAANVISITTSDGSTVCPGSLGGTWSGSTCTMPEATIPSGTTLDVGAGVDVTATNNYIGISNSGIINNYGTISGTAGTDGILNAATINNHGTMDGIGVNGIGIRNNGGAINNDGTMTGAVSGLIAGTGIYNTGTINNDGAMDSTASGGAIDLGLYNGGTINDYCGVTPSSPAFSGNSLNAIACYTVTFDQSGIPTTGVTWGVTVTWPFGATDHTGTGGSIAVPSLGGSLTYSLDTPVTGSVATYVCITGCTGTPTVSAAVTFLAAYVAETTTSVFVSPTSVSNGTSVTYSATVSPSTATGTVAFTVGSTALCTATLSGGAGNCASTKAPVGSDTVTGTYSGDTTDAVSSGAASLDVSSLPSPPPPIPSYAMPPVLNLTTYGNLSLTAHKVGMIGGGQVIYNIPSINQTLLNGELTQGNFDLFPNAMSVCSTQLYGQTYIRVSGFSAMSWGAGLTNSTEFVFGSYVSYLTGAQGWPAEPACVS
ncbi:MAG: Ig-like domain repeat protein [Nitrososphaerota archaeon]|nr:Ig-like domain repeat protein [Nitrososphaerota archaeon]MDG6976141.1 Ig-like domain repeat protein [Nitrososphaerota archaeon]MDG7014797.1 Ig-like domain repeat protein [Nitrososphaerota archaeon]WGO50762.1 MAG: Ig-like domain repeat protein [Nitrososphaerota archaeon]